jgi:hypothetical protein
MAAVWLLVIISLDTSEFLSRGQGDSFPRDVEERRGASIRGQKKPVVVVDGRQ